MSFQEKSEEYENQKSSLHSLDHFAFKWKT